MTFDNYLSVVNCIEMQKICLKRSKSSKSEVNGNY